MHKIDFDIYLSDNDLELLEDEDTDCEELIREGLDSAAPGHESIAETLFQQFAGLHDSPGDTPEVDSFDEITFNNDIINRTGSFRIYFTVHFFFGCSDMNREKGDYVPFEYELDENEKVIKCFTTVPLTRGEN